MYVTSDQIPDKDLEKRRCEQRADPLTDRLYTKSEYAPEVPAKDDRDKDDEEEEEEEEEEPEEEMIEEEEEVSYDDDCRGIVMVQGCSQEKPLSTGSSINPANSFPSVYF